MRSVVQLTWYEESFSSYMHVNGSILKFSRIPYIQQRQTGVLIDEKVNPRDQELEPAMALLGCTLFFFSLVFLVETFPGDHFTAACVGHCGFVGPSALCAGSTFVLQQVAHV